MESQTVADRLEQASGGNRTADLSKEQRAALDWKDAAALGLIVCCGALQFYFCLRSSDFLYDDVFYADGARSLLQHGLYGINGQSETNQPPGLSAILALLCLLKGCRHIVFLRAMTVFHTLGSAACYLVLRRQAPKAIAGAICLLLISSAIPFTLATQWVFPAFPYFFLTICALLAALRLEEAKSLRGKAGWSALFAGLVTASLLVASAAMALLGALVARVATNAMRDRQLAYGRLKTYLPALLVGLAVQGFWMHRKPAPLEWPLPGYPRPYLQQLKVKSGHYPELGLATVRDIPLRVGRNAFDSANLLGQMVAPRLADVPWLNALILGPILLFLLMLLGWGYSIWQTGGSLQDWYFAGYQFIYLLWPWTMEVRFLYPVAALACFYIWRGIAALAFLARCKPRWFSAVWVPVCLVLALSRWFWVHQSWRGSQLVHAELPTKMSLLGWALAGLLAGGLLWWVSSRLLAAFPVAHWFERPLGWTRFSSLQLCQALAVAFVVVLIGAGLQKQLEIGRANLDPNGAMNQTPADVSAARWIQANTEPDAILMARNVPTSYHYSGRKVVWFPPSSNPVLLMDGIRRHHVDYVAVASRKNNYYLPPDPACFQPLLGKYPEAFRLVYQEPQFKIFRVVGNSDLPSAGEAKELPRAAEPTAKP